MEHVERHHSRHAPAQLFDLVVDVEKYPDFLPWVIAARVTGSRDQTILVEMTMGTWLLHKQFNTVAFLDRPHRVEISSYDTIFERFEQIWTFAPAAEGGTNVEYRVDVKLKSDIFQTIMMASLVERSKTIVSAFIRRADRLYGAPKSSPVDGTSRNASASDDE